MRRQFVIALLALAPLWGVPLSGGADWSRLETGMSPEATQAALGAPLIRTYGRGFRVWIYDGRGEVVFGEGPGAIGWSLPDPSAESLARPIARDVLLKPLVRLPPLRSGASSTPAVDAPPNEVRFRYLPTR